MSFSRTDAVGEVLVTGASGYIATHIVQKLLSDGYHVRGTVRSLSNETKVKPLLEICPGARHPLKLVEADLLEAESWNKAVEGCSHVIHVASPFPLVNPKDGTEMIKTAIEGTLAVLAACHRHQVKRVVLTSSVAAVSGDTYSEVPPGKVYSENDWTNPDTTKEVYFMSKTLAEKAAWNYVEQLPDGERFELAVLNPDFVQGPVLCGGDAASTEVLRKLMEREIPFLPKISMGITDVRDVAITHVNALTAPDAAGHRHIISSGSLWLQDIAVILNKEFSSQGYHISTTNCPYVLLWLTSWFDTTIARIMPLYNKQKNMDNTRMKTVLGVTPTDMSKTLIDMAYSLVDKGIVRKTSEYRPRPADS